MLFYLSEHDVSVIGKLLISILIKWKVIQSSDRSSSSNRDKLISRNRMDGMAVITSKGTMCFIQLYIKELTVFSN